MSKKVQTYVIDFPDPEPKEVVTENSDGSYTIFLNAKQSSEQQKKSWIHALKHIKNDDFSKDNVQDIEACSHK